MLHRLSNISSRGLYLWRYSVLTTGLVQTGWKWIRVVGVGVGEGEGVAVVVGRWGYNTHNGIDTCVPDDYKDQI